MRGKPVIEQVYESWEWHIRDNLEDANRFIRRVYYEATQRGVKPEEYEHFMRGKIAQMLRELGDAK